MKQIALRLGSAAVIFAGLLLLWLALVRVFKIPPYMLPPPNLVARAAAERFPSLLTSLWITGAAAAGGLAASIVVRKTGTATASVEELRQAIVSTGYGLPANVTTYAAADRSYLAVPNQTQLM